MSEQARIETAVEVTIDNCELFRAQIAEQAREISSLRSIISECATACGAAVSVECSLEFMALLPKEIALKAQPSGVVQWPDADEIMQMAFEEGQPSEDASGYYFELEEFDLFIQRLMEEVARLNTSPVSAVWMMPTVKQLEHALESVPSFHDLSAELIAPAMLEHLREVISAGEYGDAYQGARQDLLIWKRRALESETKVREQDQVIENLGNALNAESGPIFMGEPVMPASAGDERAALATLERFVETVRECYHLASSYSGCLDNVDEHGGDDHEDPICAVFHRLYYAMFDGDKALDQARAALSANHSEQVRQMVPAWNLAADELPASGKTVLAFYLNSHGMGRRIRAMHVKRFTVEAEEFADPDTQCCEYSEQDDCYYTTEGWYELIDNWPDYSSCAVIEGVVTHWMPLPAAPSAGSQGGDV